MSLLLAQQQHIPICINQATIVQALAVHMNANILIPNSGTMFTVSSAPLITLLKIKNMTVAMIEAAVVVRALAKANEAMKIVAHRLKTLQGIRKIETTLVQAPVRKSANIQ